MNSLSLQRWSKGVSTSVPMDTTANVVLKIELCPGMGSFKQICSRFQSAPTTALSVCLVSLSVFLSGTDFKNDNLCLQPLVNKVTSSLSLCHCLSVCLSVVMFVIKNRRCIKKDKRKKEEKKEEEKKEEDSF